MTNTETFVRLKYKSLKQNQQNWQETCEAMPTKVRVRWALRCAKDVAHLANDFPKVALCIDAIEKWLRDEISDDELKRIGGDVSANICLATSAATNTCLATSAAHDACLAAYLASYAAHASLAASLAANTACLASLAASLAANTASLAANTAADTKWNQYCDWYWEELIKYEEEI